MAYTIKAAVPLMLIAAMALTGCDNPKNPLGKETSPAVAKVNGTALTTQQVNFALQRLPKLDPARVKEASQEIVRSLVDQEVLVQQALKEKLDRDPKVEEMLDAARRQILAQTYMERKLGSPALPSAAEVTAYYNQHPELFTQRKLFRLQEVSIKAPESEHEAIRNQLAGSKSLIEFGAWLKSKNYQVNATQEVKASEQLPAILLSKLHSMPDGQAIVVKAPEGLVVLVMAGSQVQPVAEAQAKPAIEKLLQVQKRQEAAKRELDRLKTAAKIEYLGDYVNAGKAPVALPSTDATSPAPASPTPPAAPSDTGSKPASPN